MAKNHRISKKRERAGAEELGGQTHSGSGSQWHSKADFSNDLFVVEDKFTKDIKFNLSLDILKHIMAAGKLCAKIAVLRFGYEFGYKKNYAVLNEKDVVLETNTPCSVRVNKAFNTSEEEMMELFNMLYADPKSPSPSSVKLNFAIDDSLTFRIFEWDDFVSKCELIIGIQYGRV